MDARRLKVLWTLVYAANLVMPALLGLPAVQGLGFAGVGLAIVALWFAGLPIGDKNPRVLRRLARGGVVVALSQLLPVLQIAAGTLALILTDVLPGAAAERSLELISDPMRGFMATAMTGGLLLSAALMFGAGIDRFYERRTGTEKPVGRAFDPEFDL